MAEKMQKKWHFIAASVIGVVGAFFGGVWGGLAAAFAGDSWWTSQGALESFQMTVACSGILLGFAPAAIWLLCLGQRWVLPILCGAGASLSLFAMELISMSNNVKGMLYPAVVCSGLLAGLALWMMTRRSAVRKSAPNKPLHGS